VIAFGGTVAAVFWLVRSRRPPALETVDEVMDPSGQHRLILRFVEQALPKAPRARGFNFYSLAWEQRTAQGWIERHVITSDEFAREGCRRWVIQLRSIEPGNGMAILKVGRGIPPDSAGFTDVQYTWWEWDLFNNREVRVFRDCADPFESFEAAPHPPDG
jgi:hypothetical protein